MSIDPLALAGEPVSRTDLVVQAIRTAILEGTLAPGEPLSERSLAARFGVSKSPVRDALRLLAVTGLVEINSFQRVAVRSIDASLIRELYGARLVLEPAAVTLAAQAHGPGANADARTALQAASAAHKEDDLASLGLANRRFHRALYATCGNRFLINQLDQLQDLTALAATAGWRRSPTESKEAEEHSAILAAYEAGDGALAADLMHQHVGKAAAHLDRIL